MIALEWWGEARNEREPFERDRRFVPALVVPAFEHVEHRGPAVHRLDRRR
jgi:hypothetical protein